MDIKPTRPTNQEPNAVLNSPNGSLSSSSPASQFIIRTMRGDLSGQAPQENIAKKTPAKIIPAPPAPPPPRSGQSNIYKDNKTFAAVVSVQQMPVLNINQPVRLTPTALNITPQARAANLYQTQTAKITEKTTPAALIPEKQTQKDEFKRLLKQADLKLAAKEFNAAIADAQKIITDGQAGWITKWQTKRLINKINRAQKEMEKQTTMALPSKTNSVAPLPIPATKIAEPPKIIISQPAIAPPLDLPIIEDKMSFAATPVPPKPQFTPPPTKPSLPSTPPSLPPTPPLPPMPPKPISAIPPMPAEPKITPTPKMPSYQPETPKIPASVQTTSVTPIAEKNLHPAPQPAAMPAKMTADMLADKSLPTEEFDFKKIFVAVSITILVLALIVGGLWYFLRQPAIITQTTPTPSPSRSAAPAPPPSPLITVDSQKIITLKTGQEAADWQEAAAQLTDMDEPAGNFVSLIFKDSRGQYLTLDQFASSTGIDLLDLPTQNSVQSLRDQLDMEKFTLFAYAQAAETASPFAPQANSGRIGLIVAIKDTSLADQLKKNLKDLEQLMPSALKLLLSVAPNRIPVMPVFSNGNYQNIAIRYINFPAPDHSLDYAIVKNYLIFATSKASMHAAIDRIQNSTND